MVMVIMLTVVPSADADDADYVKMMKRSNA